MKYSYPFYLVILIGVVLGAMTSCSNDDNPNPGNIDTLSFAYQVKEFLDAAGVDSTILDSGSLNGYQYYFYPVALDTFNRGGADQSQGNVLSIFYDEYALNNDSIPIFISDRFAEPIVLAQGMGATYPIGLDHAIRTSDIKGNEEYVYLIPPELGYDDLVFDGFTGIIPQNSILNFRVAVDTIRNIIDMAQSIEPAIINEYILDAELNDTSKWGRDGFVERYPSGLALKVMDSTYLPRPQIGDSVAVSYVMYFADDSTIYDRRTSVEPFVFQLGTDEVIPGFYEAILNMHLNERTIAIIPSQIGYRESATILPSYIGESLFEMKIVPEYALKVPPFKVLIFDATIELIY